MRLVEPGNEASGACFPRPSELISSEYVSYFINKLNSKETKIGKNVQR